jgi:Skp family chaperone for outer membrane proteins
MKIWLTGSILFLAITALPPTMRAQSKIGVINMSVAIGSTAEGKKAIADLNQKFAPRKQELVQLQNEIQTIQTQLSKQSPTLSDEEQHRLSRDLEEKQRVLKRSADDAQSDYNADTEETVRRIGQKMVRIIADYAPQQGFVLVLDNAQVPIYYAAKDIDIQAEIVKRYDAANPVVATGGPSKPAAHQP